MSASTRFVQQGGPHLISQSKQVDCTEANMKAWHAQSIATLSRRVSAFCLCVTSPVELTVVVSLLLAGHDATCMPQLQITKAVPGNVTGLLKVEKHNGTPFSTLFQVFAYPRRDRGSQPPERSTRRSHLFPGRHYGWGSLPTQPVLVQFHSLPTCLISRLSCFKLKGHVAHGSVCRSCQRLQLDLLRTDPWEFKGALTSQPREKHLNLSIPFVRES